MDMEKLGRRNARTDQEKKQEASTDRFEKKMGNDSEQIQANAVFEKYLREEIKERKIPVTDDDVSKIVSISTYRIGVGEPAAYKIDVLETIDSAVKQDSFRSNREEPAFNLEHKESPRRPMTDTEVEAFLKRYSPELAEAARAARLSAKTEMERMAAEKTIDEL